MDDRYVKVALTLIIGALTACATAPPSQSAYDYVLAHPYQPPSPALPPDAQWQPCVKREVDQAFLKYWVEPGPFVSEQAIVEGALSTCISSHVTTDGFTAGVPGSFARREFDAAKQQYIDKAQAAEKKKQDENHASLKREEPAASAAYRTCIFTNAAALALVSDEPAPVVASAAIAACRPQRDAWIALHQRYGDGTFDNSVMDQVEQHISATLVLSVIQTRAAAKVTPPTQAPRPPPSGDSI